MKIKSLIQYVLAFSLFSFGSFSPAYSYTLGIYSQSKQPEEITAIEDKIAPYKFPVVAFIFDHYALQGSLIMKNAVEEFGTTRTYHITLSPDHFSAEQVANGNFDDDYLAFFTDVKKYGIKVLFRTMHEMNGGRYARGGNPAKFKEARERVYALSRKAGLDKDQIQFIFSFNRHDMPAEPGQKQSQTAKLVTCTPKTKSKTGCYTWEDYYPGDDKVDIIGFSVYNRGKATSSRLRISFKDIIMDSTRNNRYRVLAKKKPVFGDEIGTSSVRYQGPFSFKKSQEVYANPSFDKSTRLTQMSEFVESKPEIIGINYFNVDYTRGLKTQLLGEADRKILDTEKGMMYPGGWDVLKKNDNMDLALLFDKYASLVKNKPTIKPIEVAKTPTATQAQKSITTASATKASIKQTSPTKREVTASTKSNTVTLATVKKKTRKLLVRNAPVKKPTTITYEDHNIQR